MKKLIFTLFVSLVMASASATAQNIVSEQSVNITINHNTSREELSELFTQLGNVGLKFQYNPKFDNNKKLVYIQYRVLDASGNELGSAVAENLQNPSVATRIFLTKENDTFVVNCIGNCE